MRSTATNDQRAQFARYLIIGTVNTALSYGVYALGLAVSLPYQLANLIAMLCGIAVGFVLHGTIVFGRQLRGRLFPFVSIWLLLYLTNITLIGVLNLAGFDYYVAGLVAMFPITLLAYTLQKQVVFAEGIPQARKLIFATSALILAIAAVNVVFLSQSP